MRKLRTLFMILLSLPAISTTVYAYLEYDQQIRMTPFWQSGQGTYRCVETDETCVKAALAKNPPRTMGWYGCAVTSMSMLYFNYGMHWMPLADNPHIPNMWRSLNPARLDDWMVENDSYDTSGISWDKTMKRFYYLEPISLYYYQYVLPNEDCAPINIQIQRKNGTFRTVKKSAQCSIMEWATPGAMTWLDYDLQNYRPPIMKISWTDAKGDLHPSHFVVIAGYDPDTNHIVRTIPHTKIMRTPYQKP